MSLVARRFAWEIFCKDAFKAAASSASCQALMIDGQYLHGQAVRIWKKVSPRFCQLFPCRRFRVHYVPSKQKGD